MARPLLKRDPDDDPAQRQSFVSAYNPFRIVVSVIRTSITYLFPPSTTLRIASHLVPLLVCISLIPLLLFFSIFSGWYIWKSIPVAWQVPVYLQYGDGLLPYAELSLPPLYTAQPYDVSLHLVLPPSEANVALGNFMTTLSLSTPSNRTLVLVSRPAIVLSPKRAPFLFPVPRLIDLDVLLLSSYVPGVSNMNARIDLGRRDGWKGLGNGEGRELSVSNAILRGTVRRHGIWGLVSRFPLTSALVASSAFFSLSVAVLTACILPAVQWPPSVDQAPPGSESKEERPARVRKRPRKSAASESRASGIAHKSEDTAVDIPSGLAPDSFSLKRRRSRTSDVFLDTET